MDYLRPPAQDHLAILPQIRMMRITLLNTDSSAPISHRSISSSLESFRRDIGDHGLLSGGTLLGSLSSPKPPILWRMLGICIPCEPKLCGRRADGSFRRDVRTRSPKAKALSLGSWMPSSLTRIMRGRYFPLLRQRSRTKQAQKVRRFVSWAITSSDVCSLGSGPRRTPKSSASALRAGDRGPSREKSSFSSSNGSPMACDSRIAMPTYSQALLPRHMPHS